MFKLVLLRHGQSQWNLENRFTGWTDVDLSEQGEKEAIEAGEKLKEAGFVFDIVFSSVLKRANRTAVLALESLNQLYVDVLHSWRLNERHYGALQGLDKAETAQKYGDEQVKIWRRSFDVRPPLLEENDPREAKNDMMYRHLAKEFIPRGESLKDTIARVLPYWDESIKPRIMAGESVLIAAHGNSLRALVKHLERLNDEEIMGVEIPTGSPLVYELDENLQVLKKYHL